MPQDYHLRRVKYLSNVIEHEHRFIEKKVRASQRFKAFHTAERTPEGIEAVNMMRKGQVKRVVGSDAHGQAKFVESLLKSLSDRAAAARAFGDAPHATFERAGKCLSPLPVTG